MRELLFLSYLIAIFFFVILGGLYSGLETAFVCTDYLRLKSFKKSKPRLYLHLEQFYWMPGYFLSLTLIGTNFCVVAASTLVTSLFVRIGLASPSFYATLILSPIVFLFSELIPKSLGRTFKESFLAYFLSLVEFLNFFKPLIRIIELFPEVMLKLLFRGRKFKAKERVALPGKRDVLTREDFKILAEALHRDGGIERLEKEAILDILGFFQTKVKDIYVRLDKVITLDYNASLDDVIRIAKSTEFRRYPVFKDSQPLGYLNIFDLFYRDFNNWQELIRPILKIGINQDVRSVLKTLRFKKENIALVFKGRRPYGIVTLQDIMQEITSSLAKF